MSRPLRALNALALAAALFGCAGGPLSGDLPGETDSGAIIGEVAGARERARIHTELASWRGRTTRGETSAWLSPKRAPR